MSVLVILVFCLQTALIQSVLSQCAGLATPIIHPSSPGLAASYGTIEVTPTIGGSLPVKSTSAFPPALTLASENAYEGAVTVVGKLPFAGTVSMKGDFPSAGTGVVNHACGSSPRITNDNLGSATAASREFATSDFVYLPRSIAGPVARSVAPRVACGGISSAVSDMIPAASTSVDISSGFNYRGIRDYSAAGLGRNGFVPSKVSYGGIGEGNIAVAGQLPVAGGTAIVGQLPILGAVNFFGEVPAHGTFTVSGSCSYGCNGHDF